MLFPGVEHIVAEMLSVFFTPSNPVSIKSPFCSRSIPSLSATLLIWVAVADLASNGEVALAGGVWVGPPQKKFTESQTPEHWIRPVLIVKFHFPPSNVGETTNFSCIEWVVDAYRTCSPQQHLAHLISVASCNIKATNPAFGSVIADSSSHSLHYWSILGGI